MNEFKITTMQGVREHGEGYPVELWVNEAGRVVVRAYNEGHQNITDVDLSDLMDWLRNGPKGAGGQTPSEASSAAVDIKGYDTGGGTRRYRIEQRDDGLAYVPVEDDDD